MRKISTLLIVLLSFAGAESWAQCPTSLVSASNQVAATYHAGGMRATNGNYYYWGQDMSPTTGFQQVTASNFGYPAGSQILGIQGGSDGDTYNQIAILVDNEKIYFNGKSIISATNPLAIPSAITDATKVGSFFTTAYNIALVDYAAGTSGKAYTYESGNGWTTISAPTNFKQVRGDNSGNSSPTCYIGFTADNKIFVWGKGLSTFNYTAPTELKLPTAMTGNIILVGANLAGSTPSYYYLTSTGQMWATGNNANKQLGDFTVTSHEATATTADWVRTRTGTTLANSVPASVAYFSTEEHDATSDNLGTVAMILTNGETWSFGTNAGTFGMLAQNLNASDHDPAITLSGVTSGSTITSTFPMSGTNSSNTATMIEVGGHITIIQKPDGSWCGAGHGTNGSLLGTDAGFPIFADCKSVSATGCSLPICRSTAPALSSTSATLACSATSYDLSTVSVPAQSGFTVKWFSDAALTNELTATSTPAITAVPTGTYYVVYYAPDINGSPCTSTAATFAVNPPTGPASAPTVSSSTINNLCSGSSVNLNTLINSTNSGAFIRWYTSGTKTQFTADSINSSAYTGTGDVYAYYITNGAPINSYCIKGATKVTVTAIGAPTLNGTNTISNTCPTETVNLNTLIKAADIPSGTQIRWYTTNNKTTVTADSLNSAAYGTAGTVYAYYIQTGAAVGSTCIKGATAVTVTINSCFGGTLQCDKTQIITAPVAGVAGQKAIALTLNVTQAGCTNVTLSGSGFTLQSSPFQICATTTGVKTFYIPANYDGTSLGSLTLNVANTTGGSGTGATATQCVLDLTKPVDVRNAVIQVWSTECLPTCGPGLK